MVNYQTQEPVGSLADISADGIWLESTRPVPLQRDFLFPPLSKDQRMQEGQPRRDNCMDAQEIWVVVVVTFRPAWRAIT